MTPAEALDDQKEFEARTNLEIRCKKFRRYPELDVGDKVEAFRKRSTFAKEDRRLRERSDDGKQNCEVAYN